MSFIRFLINEGYEDRNKATVGGDAIRAIKEERAKQKGDTEGPNNQQAPEIDRDRDGGNNPGTKERGG